MRYTVSSHALQAVRWEAGFVVVSLKQLRFEFSLREKVLCVMFETNNLTGKNKGKKSTEFYEKMFTNLNPNTTVIS